MKTGLLLVHRSAAVIAALTFGTVAVEATPGTDPATNTPSISVLAVDGSPQLRRPDGLPVMLAAESNVAPGATVITDAGSRVVLAFSRGAKAGDDSDILFVGPGSRLTLVPQKQSSTTDELWAPMTVQLERGSYRGVTRRPGGKSLFAVATGDRTTYFQGADSAGTYMPETDAAEHLVKTGSIVIRIGERKIRLREGMVRVIAEGRVRGARACEADQWTQAVAVSSVAGVEVSVPVTATTATGSTGTGGAASVSGAASGQPDPGSVYTGIEAPPGMPKPWEYDAETNRFWHPRHKHWHSGRPPAEEVSGSGEASEPPATTTSGTPATEPPATGVASTPPVIDPAATTRSGADVEFVRLKTSLGEIVLELDRARAPISVDNFLAYVDSGFYDETIFHRVIENFMIQGGGFTADMTKKPTRPAIKNEWRNQLKNVRGSVAMARLGSRPDSATAQFFINVTDNAALDAPRDGAGYAVFGKVVMGMDVVDEIRTVRTHQVGRMGDVPVEPVVIVKAERTTRAALE